MDMQNKSFFSVHQCTQMNREKPLEKHRQPALVISRERTKTVVAKEGEI